MPLEVWGMDTLDFVTCGGGRARAGGGETPADAGFIKRCTRCNRVVWMREEGKSRTTLPRKYCTERPNLEYKRKRVDTKRYAHHTDTYWNHSSIPTTDRIRGTCASIDKIKEEGEEMGVKQHGNLGREGQHREQVPNQNNSPHLLSIDYVSPRLSTLTAAPINYHVV